MRYICNNKGEIGKIFVCYYVVKYLVYIEKRTENLYFGRMKHLPLQPIILCTNISDLQKTLNLEEYNEL